MGCSSEAARKRKQRRINSHKNHYNKNIGAGITHSNSQTINKNNNNCCDNYITTNSNNLLLLSSELICQNNSDSEDESTIIKDNNNYRLRKVDKTTVKEIEKTQKQQQGDGEEASCASRETEIQTQSECSNISRSVEVEIIEVLVEETQRADERCKFCATCKICCACAIDINNNNNNNSNTNSKDFNKKGSTNSNKEITSKKYTNNNNKEYNTSQNFCSTTSGSNYYCHRQFAREQLPQARVALPPQVQKDEQEHDTQPQTQAAEDELWHTTCVGVLPASTEMDADKSTTSTALEACHNYKDDDAAAVHKKQSQSVHELLLQARNALTKRLVGLSDDISLYADAVRNVHTVREEEMHGSANACVAATRCERRGQYQQRQECWKIEPLQLAYKQRRQHVSERMENQQKQKQRNDKLRFEGCRRRTKKQKVEQQQNAITYCQQKQKNDHQKLKQPKVQQQQQQPQQMPAYNKYQTQTKASQLQQQEQHSAQELQQQKLLLQKPTLQLHKQQQQKQQQTQQRHLLRRGIQTMAAAAYGAFSYIGHNYYHLLGNSISFYAASSVILVLCYLTTTTGATHSPEKAPFDRHPIRGIDWTKFDESSSDKEILDLLLEKKRYDKRLLPPVNDEDFCCGLSSPDMAKVSNSRRPHNRGTLTVNVNVLLLSLASPDESSLKYEVEFLLNQQWNDPRLQYGNKSHYDFLNALHHHDSIWTPDTYFIMHGDFKDPIIPMHFALRIYRNGTITYAMRRHLILSCQGSLHIFPFDDPKCSFSMESISYEEAQIKYVWKNDEDTLRKSPSLTTLNAYLIKNQTTPCDQNSWRGNYSCLEVELTFTRDRAYYFTTVFIPGIILVTSSFITFWLEWNAVPARVMIGVTTMLNFFTTSNGFRSTLPVVSNLTAMNVWDGVCMCFIYASLLEFVCVNYMGRKRPQHNAVYRPGENPVTQRLPAVLSRIGVILASPLGIIEREFLAALSSEKAATQGASSSSTNAGTSIPVTPTPHMMHTYQTHTQQQQQWAPTAPPPPPPTSYGTTSTGVSTVDAPRIRWEEQHGGIIGVAMQNLRARSIRRRTRSPGSVTSAGNSYADTETGRTGRTSMSPVVEPVYHEPTFETAVSIGQRDTTVTVEMEPTAPEAVDVTAPTEQRSRTISTNTPPLITSTIKPTEREEKTSNAAKTETENTLDQANAVQKDATQTEAAHTAADASGHLPVKPPRRKRSRSSSPAPLYEQIQESAANGRSAYADETGEKRRDVRAPNEIVACTTCGGSSSPCTHSANNGCATETCFVQVRKKEPPHPIRIAKTIDVIARITFPTAYAIFLIFFFVHYKGFS
ncbi:uncharacterized protein pHCl-1 isoform X4 [Eurosta solidaginis]|uniref:uncharacterized protein pHCl-1 isoform X4 n=1 Tax=Eurosta solidaginis TaxID=178769 RepID=UPI00353114C3